MHGRAWLPALLLGAAGLAHADPQAQFDYILHCMGCHVADGSGAPPQVPDVRGEMGRLLAVEGGREYLIQVPGAATSTLSDAALAAVLNYMLETFSADTLPESFEPITEAEVARLRPQWLQNPQTVRAKLLAALDAGAESAR